MRTAEGGSVRFRDPSESAVGFYLRFGFAPTPDPIPELFELEPENIHMVRDL